MAVQTSTGVSFSVVAETPATPDVAGFEALTFVEVGEVTDVPEYGASASVVEHMPLATGVVEKYKGFINFGSMSVSLGRDVDDAGQALLKAAVTGAGKNVEHSFKIGFPDGSSEYATGKVFSYTTNPGSANSIVGSTANIEINTEVVEAAAP